jgi:hypothetical protein
MKNVDATIFQKDNRMRLGIVIRDHREDLLSGVQFSLIYSSIIIKLWL